MITGRNPMIRRARGHPYTKETTAPANRDKADSISTPIRIPVIELTY